MNTYQIIGLLFFMVMLPIPIGWILIHKTIKFWRKLGKVSYLLIILGWIGFALIIYQFRGPIINIQLNYPYFRSIGLMLLVIALYLDYLRAKVFSLRYLIGLPEIQNKSKLIISGIYSKIRHPRYLSYIIAYLGLTFFTQLLSLFIVFPVFVVLMYVLTLFEEKELIKRFGQEYIKYIKRTPRFFPLFIKYKT